MPKRSTASSEPSPLPVPVCEALGLASVRQLSELFHSECAALGGRKLHSHFEQWLWSARAGVSEEAAPVIPHPPAAEASTALRRKLVCAGMSEEAALAATAALEQRAKALAGRLACARAAAGPQQAASEVRLSGSGSGGTVTLSCGGESVVCKRSHLEKLRALLRSGDAGDAAAASGERLFERSPRWALVARALVRGLVTSGRRVGAPGLRRARPPPRRRLRALRLAAQRALLLLLLRRARRRPSLWLGPRPRPPSRPAPPPPHAL
mmetsp:Transcript_14280/g.42145  ORF Transcript_14280/g.42145 Transcript_14280/m.42145 type:complete len:266 (+) Transcript_14280:172-969(+)